MADRYEQGTDVTGAVRVLHVMVVTPEATVLRRNAEFVALPLYDGELGVLPGRAPLIGRLGFGELRVREGDVVDRYFVEGGFAQVVGDNISVLTNHAIPADKIDADVAREQLSEAQSRKANTDELLEIRDRLIKQARAQIRIAERTGK
ncbi:MAG: ATP synthase F1 subunit epsilon [Pirellulales bacterium]